MSNDKEFSGVFKRIGKWWIIIIGLILSTFALIYGGLKVEGFPTEQYTSVAAFIMLISTAILQNIDLDLQRKDLQLNRRALEEQREEMQKHTEEFAKTNKSNDESLEMQKFFELVRLKEDLYIDIIKERNRLGINALEEFNDMAIYNIWANARVLIANEFRERLNLGTAISITDDIAVKIYKETDDEGKERIYELINESIEETNVFSGYGQGVENSLIKLHNYNSLLERMIDEGTLGTINSVFSSINTAIEPMRRMTESLYGRDKLETTIKHVYKGLLTDDEILLYEIIEKRVEPNRIFNFEDAE